MRGFGAAHIGENPRHFIPTIWRRGNKIYLLFYHEPPDFVSLEMASFQRVIQQSGFPKHRKTTGVANDYN